MTGRRPAELDADVVVIGLGALGSATAWQLARRGAQVVGLERFTLGHERGASHGDSRIIRLSYHTPAYVRRAQEAYRDWADLEQASGQSLLLRCGGIDVFPDAAAIPIDDYVAAMTAVGVPFDVLSGTQASQRWPALTVPHTATVVHQGQTGIVPATAGTLAMQACARAAGAVLCAGRTVVELTDSRGAVRVRCADGTLVRARTAVVTADAWTNQVLAGLDVRVPLTVTKEHVVHFAVDGERHAPGAFPVWIWMDDPSYFGFPMYGEASVKVGQDCGGRPVDPDTRDFVPDPDYIHRMRQFVARVIPQAGAVRRITTCLYTLTPDRDFVAGPVPGHEQVVVGLGAAHGFKFAPWFGRVLADLATTGVTSSDLSGLAVDRPALISPPAVHHWLV